MAEDVFGIVGTTQAGTYQVESVVAEGGFGVVYRAYHGAFRAPVALKCLKIPQSLNAKSQSEFLERFREEAELMFRLSAGISAVVRPLHADVITTANGTFVPFMALEWLDGETLDVLVSGRAHKGRPPLALKRAARLLAPVARALEVAHNFPGPGGTTLSIVHRDLKPDNIFIAEINGEQVAKILDFGIAKVRNTATAIAGRASQSEAVQMAFTPGYGAPEQWLPKRFGQTGPWTDVYGLALTLVETVAGHPVIDGDLAGMMGTAIDEQRRPSPRTEGVQVSDEVEAVFLRALAVDPRGRQPDCGVFWDELEDALGLDRTFAPLGRRDRRAEGGGAHREERLGRDRRPITQDGDEPPASVPALVTGGSFFEGRLAQRPAAGAAPPSLSGAAPHTPAEAPPSLVASSVAAVAAVAPSVRPAVPSHPPESAPRTSSAGRAPAPAPAPQFGDLLGGMRDASGGGDTGNADLVLELDPQEVPMSVRAKRTTTTGGSPNSSGSIPLDVRGSSPRTRSERPSVRSSGAPGARPSHHALGQHLGGPASVATAGLAVAVADKVYTAMSGGEELALGPLRLAWVAGGVVMLAMCVLLWRLVSPSAD